MLRDIGRTAKGLEQRRDKRATILKRPGKNTGASGNVLGSLPRSMAYKPFWGNPKTSINLEKTTAVSFPEGQSINYSIDLKVVLIFLHYSGRNYSISRISKERGHKVSIPTDPSFLLWLGMNWQNKIYVDGTLLLGLRLAPKVFKMH